MPAFNVDHKPNPFAPPSADLISEGSDQSPSERVLATPWQRLVLCLIGIALGSATCFLSLIAVGWALWKAKSQAEPELPVFLAAGVLLLIYLPFGAQGLSKYSGTLPMRFFGLRFELKDGGKAAFHRCALLHVLPSLLCGWVPPILATYFKFRGTAETVMFFSGLLLLLINALASFRPSRRTFIDQLAGLSMVKS